MNTDLLFSQKHDAAKKALDFIDNHMVIGLGTGSTANIFIDLVAQFMHEKKYDLKFVVTSHTSEARARALGLEILSDGDAKTLDIAVDGADEFDTHFRLIKGGGGALLREKIIASAANHFIVIADDTKKVETLGNFPLPIECVPYELGMIKSQLEKLYNRHASSHSPEFNPIIRKNKDNTSYFLTDLGHYIIDLSFAKINDPESLAHDLQYISGIVDHGLFLKEAQTILTNSYVLNKSG